MPLNFYIQWDEGPLSVGGRNGRGQIKYYAVSDEPAAHTRETVLSALLATAPPVLYGGLTLDTVNVAERRVDNVDASPPLEIWDCEANYVTEQFKDDEPLQCDTPRPFRLTIRTGNTTTKRMTRSLEFLKASSEPGFEFDQPGYSQYTDLSRYIGWNGTLDPRNTAQISAEGINVPFAGVEIGVETVASNAEVSNKYLVDLSLYAGLNVVNEKDWEGFPAKTLRFTNFDAKQRADTANENNDPTLNEQCWDINMTFAYAPKEMIDPPDDGVPAEPVEKPGHYLADLLYMPFTYEQTIAPQAVLTMPKLVRVAVHKIYPEIDFKLIFDGTGGTPS